MTKERTTFEPDTLDQLSPIEYRFALEKNPNLAFWITECTLPGITTTGIDVPTGRFAAIKVPGDTLQFEDLTISFIVDEEMANYIEIQNWLYALTTARDTRDFKNLKKEKPEGERQDVHLTILSNKANANIRIKFHNSFPTQLSSIQFDTKRTDTDPITVTATFSYTTYTIESI